MVILALLSAISLALSLILTPLCRAVALKLKIVDVPDRARKAHRHSIPRIGGVAVYLAYYGCFLIVAAVLARGGIEGTLGLSAVRAVAPAAALVFLVGFLDDVIGLKPWHKLFGEIVAGSILVAAGVHLPYLAGNDAQHWLAAGATVLWVALCANAVNLIDGVDGLASGVALTASITICAASLLHGDLGLAVAMAPLAGALAGFLVFNFNPASIFLGDSGSLVLGFLLGCYSILWVGDAADMLGMAAPLIALAIPLLDTTLAIFRRFLRRQPIFGADRSHIHHRLLARGFTSLQTTLVLYAAAGIAGVLSLLLVNVHEPWREIVIAVFVCGTLAGVDQLRYAEFGAARRLVLTGGFRRTLNQQIALQNLEDELSKSATPQDCWAVVELSASRDFGFHQVRMQFAGHTFEQTDRVRPAGAWAIRIQISGDDWIELFHEPGYKAPRNRYASNGSVEFAETIRRALGPGSPISGRSLEARFHPGVLTQRKQHAGAVGSEIA
jgi:UDP-GlcNAc:undecaprenyl-phosphate GlcNAc-1-phosphate transferase